MHAVPTASSDPNPSPTPTPEPTVAELIIVNLDGLTRQQSDGVDEFPFTDGEAMVAMLEELIGTEPEISQDEVTEITSYEWPVARVIITPGDGFASIAIRAAEIGGIPIRTPEGLGVGSSREEAVAAGAWDDWDADSDGIADYLGIGPREVPGTQSLSNPGAVGIEYLLLGIAEDLIEQIQAPANDFSDV